ncbi:MAG: GNAT family N-acetyltransferase [Clostridia bacterium]|nr:GNAT family N-acetyltransferase [Clostridia bacterium]
MEKPFDTIPYLESERIILKKIERSDAGALDELRKSPGVYKYLPTFLFERKCRDIYYVIEQMYGECFENRESIHLGIFLRDGITFCGIGEMYGYREEIRKISMGYRLLERFWGKGIATEAVGLMVDYLYNRTDTGIITASTMTENKASANVLKKNGFIMTVSGAEEDWGFDGPTIADKWFR